MTAAAFSKTGMLEHWITRPVAPILVTSCARQAAQAPMASSASISCQRPALPDAIVTSVASLSVSTLGLISTEALQLQTTWMARSTTALGISNLL